MLSNQFYLEHSHLVCGCCGLGQGGEWELGIPLEGEGKRCWACGLGRVIKSWRGRRSYIAINAGAWDLHVSCKMGMGAWACGACVCCWAACLSPPCRTKQSRGWHWAAALLCVFFGKLSFGPLRGKGMSLGSRFDSRVSPVRSCGWLPCLQQQRRKKSCEPILVWDPLAGAVSSSPWFLKLLCPNAKAALAEISFYMYTRLLSICSSWLKTAEN